MIYEKVEGVKNKEEIRQFVHRVVLPKMVWGKSLQYQDNGYLNRWKNIFNIDEDVLKFYTNKHILFEIVKSLGTNELCIAENIRHLYASKIVFLMKNFGFYKVIENPKSCYKGLSSVSRREQPPYEKETKLNWQEEYWSNGKCEFEKRINGYDLGIDLDAETFEESYKDAKKLFKIFTKHQIRFSVWCSGKKGWHFIVPFSEFKNLIKPFNPDNVVLFCKAVALDLKRFLKLQKIDMVIYSKTRYLKCPYTLDKRNNRVIFPLINEEFLNFKNEYMGIEYCLSQKDLGNRGCYFDRKHNPDGFKKMVGEI